MLLAVMSGFVLSLPTPLVCRLVGRKWAGWLLALLPLGLMGYFACFARRVEGGERILFSHDWLPGLDVRLSFSLDGLSLLFCLVITGIGALVIIYSGSYLSEKDSPGIFFSYMLIFMASMLGLVLADSTIALYVFWELTSVSSYLLIGFHHERAASRKAALQALIVTNMGGLALLAGILLLYQAGGSFEISQLLSRGETVRSHALHLPVLYLILAAAFTKSAQVPFHFWLPNAMEAPTPVSTYLHSATMVKAGIYLLARFSPILGGTQTWTWVLAPVGGTTMVVGAWLALMHTDLKRILAYSTVSALGMMVLMLGIGTEPAVKAAMAYLLAHALYKGALFLVAGGVDHAVGTRDAEKLGGLFGRMPILAVGAGLAALSSAGAPLLFGFVGKELVYEAAFGYATGDFLVLVAAGLLFASISYTVVAAVAGFRPFFGPRPPLPQEPHPPPPGMWIAPCLLGLLGLILGLRPDLVEGWLIGTSTSAVRGESVSVHLVMWHGFNLPAALSLLAILLGIGLYFAWGGFRSRASRLDSSSVWGPARLYERAFELLHTIARSQTRILQSGYLHLYLFTIILTATGLLAATLTGQEIELKLSRWSNVMLHELLLALIIIAATTFTMFTRSLLAAVVAVGVVGYGVALVFMFFSAPDLAMTQFAIETLSVILLVLVLFRLPDYQRFSRTAERVRDALAALVIGGLMGVLALAITAVQKEATLSRYFMENSVPGGKGRNVVNVILVDFRGLDTMGEITVLAVAAIGVFSLARLFMKTRGREGREQ